MQKIYKNFIPLQLASPERFHREEFGMDAIYLLILAALYGVSHALVCAFERLGKTA